MAALAKEVNPKIKTFAFGIHVTALPEESLKMEKDLDGVIRGEPEITVKKIAMAMAKKRSFKNRRHVVCSVCFENRKKIKQGSRS